MASIPTEGSYEVRWAVGGTKANTAPIAAPEELTFSNAGKQNLNGYTNLFGIVKGDGNGAIDFGSSGDHEKKAAALKGLLGAIDSKDDGKTQNGSPTEPPNNHPTSMPGTMLVNNGEQMLKGVTNQMGLAFGRGNGAITFRDNRM